MDLEKNWLREFARDFIAFGSIPFLLITIARVSVIEIYYPMQFIIGSVIFFVLRSVFKADMHAGLGFILLTFTSIFYKSLLFLVFAIFVYVGIIISLFYLKYEKKEVLKGVLFGSISTAVAYCIVRLIFI